MPLCSLPVQVQNECVLIRFGVRSVATSRAAFLESVAKRCWLTGFPLRQMKGKRAGFLGVPRCAGAPYGSTCCSRKVGWEICKGSLQGQGLWLVKVGTESWSYEVFEPESSSDGSQHRILMAY